MAMKKQSGFTIIELIVTLVIAAIAMAIAVPGMRMFVQKGKIISARDDLRSGLYLARSMAIKDNLTGCVCTASDVNAPACDGGAEWELGWIAFQNAAGDCVYSAADDILLKVYDGSDNQGVNFAIRADNASINAVNYMRFTSRGLPQQVNGIGQQGVFNICDDRGVVADANGNTEARGIVVSISGSIRDTRNVNQITVCPW